MAIRFHVNVDHVATVRNARGTRYPDPVEAALVCERAGADGITAHLREDRRHVQDRDLERLRESVTTLLNMEMAATPEMVAVACRVVPDVVTLVPERREERTTEGGLDVVGARDAVGVAVARLRDRGIKVSLFVDPDAAQIDASRAVGAAQVELHTGDYCDAAPALRAPLLAALERAARDAHERGLEVAAGHGLTRANVLDVASIDEVVELNIGHALVADAIFAGLPGAVREMRAAIDRGVAARRR